MKVNSVIFREYDIRGVYDEDFNNDFARNLGRALVTYISDETGSQNPKIVIGNDARLSCPGIVDALSAGIQASGGKVVRIGLVTTPVTYYSTFAWPDVDGAFMVTGSHNPPEYNGFKISVGPTTIFGENIQKLRKIIEDERYLSGSGTESSVDILPEYCAHYKEEFAGLKEIPVVLDCGNGSAGSVARRLYETVGLKPTILFEEPDGNFPNHHPDPTVPENLQDLIAEVKRTNSLIGIGFDGDADRIGVVDGQGRILYGDELIALMARFVLKDNPGKKIIGDVKCSDRLYDYISKYGGVPIMWLTGHSLVKEKIKVEKSPFGGELSGHVFYADRNYGYDDALYAGLRVIEILSETGQTIGELLEDFPPANTTPEIRIDTTEEKKHSIVTELKKQFPEGGDDYELNTIDGIRISFKDGWALARASNTQPVLVLRFEANSEENLNEIRTRVESIVNPLL